VFGRLLGLVSTDLHARGVSRVHPPDMTERIIVPDVALDELEASRSYEVFYDAEARTLFRRLWLVTGNRAEATHRARPTAGRSTSSMSRAPGCSR
jgi:hypothetical protein